MVFMQEFLDVIRLHALPWYLESIPTTHTQQRICFWLLLQLPGPGEAQTVKSQFSLTQVAPTQNPLWSILCVCVCVCMCVCLVASQLCLTLLQPHGLSPARLLCLWDFPGNILGVGRHSLLQGIFFIQGSTHISCISSIAGGFFTTEPSGKPIFFNNMEYFPELKCLGNI